MTVDSLLARIRVQHSEALDQLLTEQVASLLHAGAVTLESVAQDGVRVRAHAGGSSFRRQETLDEYFAELRRQVEKDPGLASRQENAARERPARERVANANGNVRRQRNL